MKNKLGICLFLCLAISFSGCYSLRKKFVRKRKKYTPPPLYLELKEYPATPTKEVYEEYFLYVKGWLSELIKCLEEKISRKREKKSIDQALFNLEQIMVFLNDKGKKKIEPIKQELVKLREKIYNPYFSYTNVNYLIRKTEKVYRDFDSQFSYNKAKGFFVKE